MSRRVAVRDNGDTVEKFAFLAPLASAAISTVGRAAATKVGQTALGQGAKSMAGKLAESQVGQMAGKVAGKAKDVLGEDAGKKIGEAGAAMAQMQQQKQQAMQQQNQQMAEKAKAGSQIATGEPMDMSWRLLKDMYFTPQFQTPEYAQARQRLIDEAIENMQRQQYFGEQHHGKIRAGMVEGLTPNERNEYKDEQGREIEPRHPADYMYDQEHSDPKKFPGMYNIPAHQMLNAAGSFVNFSNLPNWKENRKVRAIVPNLFERKKDGWQSETLQEYTPVLQDAFSEPSLRSTLEANKRKEKEGAVTVSPYSFMQRNLNRKDDMLALTQQKLQQDRKEREKHRMETKAKEEEERKKETAARIEETLQGRKDDRNRRAAETRAANQAAGIEEEKQRIQVSAEETKQEREGFLDTDEGKTIAAKFTQFMGMPGMHGYYDGEREQMISPQRIRTLPLIEQAVYRQLVKRGILKSTPMDMAWRMLKGELQLPHQITEALRDDLSTLDRAHKMTDTNEGTLIENIHPDMEQVVKLLAEKHLGELNQPKSRPPMPLFHGQFL